MIAKLPFEKLMRWPSRYQVLLSDLEETCLYRAVYRSQNYHNFFIKLLNF